MLVGARFLQGIGGAMTSAVILGMIVTMFPEPREQAKAIGVYAFVASAGGAVGLLAGGVITQAINWHWIFFVNVPIGIATAIAIVRLLDRDEGIGLREGADIPGAVLITSALMLGVYTIVKPAAENGWGASRTLELGALSLALLAAFVAREATARKPLMPLRIFRSRNVAGANLVQMLVGRRDVRHVLPRRAVPAAGARLRRAADRPGVPAGDDLDGHAVGSLLRAADHALRRARRVMFPGLALIAPGSSLFARAPAHGSYVDDILPVMVLFGIGAGVCFPALMTLAMSGATPSDAGLASGLVNTTAQVGGALGLAVLATLSASHSNAPDRGGQLDAQRRSPAATTSRSGSRRRWSAAAIPSPSPCRRGRRAHRRPTPSRASGRNLPASRHARRARGAELNLRPPSESARAGAAPSGSPRRRPRRSRPCTARPR